MSQGICSRADLLRLVEDGRPLELSVAAGLIGFRLEESGQQPKVDLEKAAETAFIHNGEPAPTLKPATSTRLPLAKIPFWRVEACSYFPSPDSDEKEDPEPPPPREHSLAPPAPPPLAPWNELRNRLERFVASARQSPRVDIEKAVRRLALGQLLAPLPCRSRASWGRELQLVMDRSDRLMPFWRDQDALRIQIRRLLPITGLEFAVFHEIMEEPCLERPDDELVPYRPPPPGGTVLVLGDLGTSDPASSSIGKWRRLGQRLHRQGCRTLALSPVGIDAIPRDLRRLWLCKPWERPREPLSPEERGACVERSLTLASVSNRIESGFLRQLRHLLGGDAQIEMDAWWDSRFSGRNPGAATLDPAKAKSLRCLFGKEPAWLRAAVLRCLRTWRAHLDPSVWWEEIFDLDAESQGLLPAGDLLDARRFVEWVAQDMADLPPDSSGRAWGRRFRQRMPDHLLQDPRLRRHVDRITFEGHRFAATEEMPSVNPRNIAPDSDGTCRDLDLFQSCFPERALELVVPQRVPGVLELSLGSWLGRIPSRNDRVEIVPARQADPEDRPDADIFWHAGFPPSWASSWGRDRYGAWVSLEVEGADEARIEVRMRWIRSGQFLMGSPKREEGRDGDEGPRHKVTISKGFWLFETPVTQALWTAVMGDNPSRFKDARRPVENVSWEKVQGFLGKLDGVLGGTGSRDGSLDQGWTLPTEAQWEYSCRAGTETATYAGDLWRKEEPESLILDRIAWYRKSTKRGTQPVGEKGPNPWGLYDMLGNVYEWCRDHERRYETEPEVDPVGVLGSSAGRQVVRGGSWIDVARDIRSAFRTGRRLGSHFDYIGFRPARVPVSQEPEPAETEPGRQAERRLATDRDGVATLVTIQADQSRGSGSWPGSGPLIVRSDSSRLELGRLELPYADSSLGRDQGMNWASALGRDRYGLWASFEMERARPEDGPPIVTRLRWIPPGSFGMGSPKEEEGRFDWESPRHDVIISKGFWLFETPVTQALWTAVMGDNPSRFKDARRPVENVSWEKVQGFLGKLDGVLGGTGSRDGSLDQGWTLPTEAQWEYSCRAGTETSTYAGDLGMEEEHDAAILDRIAWYDGNSGGKTHPVGEKLPNPWGLHDMLGNVWEWCQDHWHGNYEGALSDGSVWEDDSGGKGRVIRGGSWINVARGVRSASRFRFHPESRYDGGIGFRPARV